MPRKVPFHCRWPYVHCEFFYTSGKELFQAKLQNNRARSNLTFTNRHKNTIQVENQMIVNHFHCMLSLLRRTKTHSNLFMLSILNKIKRWCKFLSIVFLKIWNCYNLLVCVTSNTKSRCNLLRNKIHRWINLKQIDLIQGNCANSLG